MAGHRVVTDPRNSLYLEMLEIVKHIQPDFIVMENVEGLRSMLDGKVEAKSEEIGSEGIGMASKFSFEITVEGQEKPPKKMAYDLKLPKKLEKMGDEQMVEWVRQQVRSGRDVFGNVFAPLSTGEPATLNRTGAMLEGVTPSTWVPKHLKGRDTLGMLAITDTEERYPWVINAGVDPDKYKGDRIAKLQGKIDRKLARKRRKLDQLTETNNGTKKWLYLLETAQGIDRDVAEFRHQIAEVQAKQVVGMPPRPWWGLMDEKRERVYAALQNWLATLIDMVVANACNPEKTTLAAADAAAQKAFEAGLRGQETA